jgi:molecular chaperone GrpE
MNRERKPEEQTDKGAVSPNDGPDPASVEEPAAETSAESLEPRLLTAAEIEELKAEAAKAKEHWNQLLRTAADFENFKKRVARERHEASRFVNERLLQKLIPVLDNFDAALAATGHAPATDSASSLQTGISMIYQQLKNVLTEAGLEEVDATNKQFDPNWHEAISQQETADAPEGQVVQQLRKGYKLRDRLLRPAGVVVAKRPKETPAA